MRLLITADTHGPRHGLPQWLLAAEGAADLVLHAGDLCDAGTLQALAAQRPVYAVQGNRDVGLTLPHRLILACDGISIGLVHGDLGQGDDTPERAWCSFAPLPDVVVFGHSHRQLLERRNGVWLVNPGSPTTPKDGRPGALLLEVAQGAVSWRPVGPREGG